MADTMLVDGAWGDRVPADDRGLAYGDGVFRTLRVEAGQPVAWRVHMQRLAYDCARLDLPRPDESCLAAEAAQLFTHTRSGVLKIVITRGSGGRGYTPPPRSSRRILSAHPLPEHATGEAASLELEQSCVVLACQPRLAGVKHLNRLEQVLARDECARAGSADAFMSDHSRWIIATTMRNLLFQDSGGRWLTPALTQAGIIGAARQRLMGALGGAGTPVQETDIGAAALDHMNAAVACNSVGGAVVVTRMATSTFPESEMASEYCRRLLEDY